MSASRNLRFRVIIPARYASSRLPAKVLAPLAGRPLLQHVWERASASAASEVLIATDDERVLAAAQGFGAEALMTAASHRSGTERLAEVAARRGFAGDEIIVNCQGDAPLIPTANINQVAGLLAADPAAEMATLCTPLLDAEDYASVHVVKVVFDQSGRALYFSRAPIPGRGHGVSAQPRAYRHLGLYAYRARALARLAAAPPCALEQAEQLEQLRALWLGMLIRIAVAVEVPGPDVDTAGDLATVARQLES